MDRLADAVGLDPVEIRVRNGFHEGSTAPTGQVIDSAAPVAELVERLRAMPLPETLSTGSISERLDLRRLPGGVANTTHGEGIRRGVGLRGRLQERRVLRGLRRLLDRPGAALGHRARPRGDRAHRGGRGGPGTGHDRAADLPHRARRRAGGRRAEGHPGRLRGVELGVAPDLRHRRGGQGRVRERPQAGADPRGDPAGHERRRAPAGGRRGGRRDRRGRGHAGRPARRRRRRGHRRVAAPADVPHRPRDRAGAARTCSTPSRRTARSSTSTSSSAWSRSSSSPAPRTSAGR